MRSALAPGFLARILRRGIAAAGGGAAVFQQKLRQAVDAIESRGIADGAAVLMRADEIGGGEDIEMEGKSGAGKMEPFGDIAGREALRGVADEEAEDVQAGFLSESGEGVHGLRCFHGSRIMEMIVETPASVKEAGLFRLESEGRAPQRRRRHSAGLVVSSF